MNDTPIEAALRSCSLYALLIIISRALSKSGFGDVQILDRRLTSQKSRHGGHELLCETLQGNRPVRIIVKVVPHSIRLRNLDELAGAVVRMNVDAGMVVSAFPLTKKARDHMEGYGPIRTSAIDGTALGHWLQELKIGIRGAGDVDYAFFGELEAASAHVQAFLSKVRP